MKYTHLVIIVTFTILFSTIVFALTEKRGQVYMLGQDNFSGIDATPKKFSFTEKIKCDLLCSGRSSISAEMRVGKTKITLSATLIPLLQLNKGGYTLTLYRAKIVYVKGRQRTSFTDVVFGVEGEILQEQAHYLYNTKLPFLIKLGG